MTRRRAIVGLLLCTAATAAVAVQNDTFLRRWLVPPPQPRPLLDKVVPHIRFDNVAGDMFEHLGRVAGVRIELPAGTIKLSNTLSLDAKNNITIRGAGQDKTILSFKNQRQGAEGLKITNAQQIVLEHFTIEDSKGDLIKA